MQADHIIDATTAYKHWYKKDRNIKKKIESSIFTIQNTVSIFNINPCQITGNFPSVYRTFWQLHNQQFIQHNNGIDRNEVDGLFMYVCVFKYLTVHLLHKQ